jgi:hypothetical protein
MDKEAVNSPRPAVNRPKDRVAIALELEVSGCAIDGRDFMDRSRTRIISRGGAAIVINRRLAPQQTVTIRREGSEQDAEARVIGHLGREPRGGEIYGIALIGAASSFWGIDFPAEEAEETLVKMLLECPRCHTRQMVGLSQLEFDVFEAKGHLSRSCSKCHDATLWRQAAYGVPPESPTGDSPPAERLPSSQPASAPPAPAARNRRRHARVKTGLKGCILFYAQETLIEVTDMSRSGIRFHSNRSFAQGLLVRVAVPYTPGAANILVSGRNIWPRKTFPCMASLKRPSVVFHK